MRRDWWRLWFSSRKEKRSVLRNAVALTLAAESRELTIGYRRKAWKDEQ